MRGLIEHFAHLFRFVWECSGPIWRYRDDRDDVFRKSSDWIVDEVAAMDTGWQRQPGAKTFIWMARREKERRMRG